MQIKKIMAPSATNETVWSKINNLRSAFRKELKKVTVQKNSVHPQMTFTSLHCGTMNNYYYLLLTKKKAKMEFQMMTVIQKRVKLR
jgi:hypothetical protein